MKMIQPRVSIVIPVYNGANYLAQAIDSALAQTYRNLEIVVVNDGSTDDGATERIAKSYGGKITYFEKKNGGVASALNLGIKKMTGEYFSWLSHDDLYAKTKIEEQIRHLVRFNDQDVIVASQVKTLFDSGVKVKRKIHARTFSFIDIFLSTSAQVGLNGCSLLIPKKAFDVCGLFDETLQLTQDYDLWFRMKDRYRFVLLNRFLVVSRRHPEQDSEQKHRELVYAGDNLHDRFLKTIDHSRFKEYFKKDKRNIRHIYENYRLYKSRGYTKTAFAILTHILRYYNETNKNNFYRIFQEEVDMRTSKHDGTGKKSSVSLDRKMIDRMFDSLQESSDGSFKLREPAVVHVAHSKSGNLAYLLKRSIKEDGAYLTLEKAVRKFIRKIVNRVS